MIATTSSPPLRFSSSIRFVSKNDFNQALQQNNSSELRETLDTFSKTAHTTDIRMCNGGGVVLKTAQKVVIYHFGGDLFPPEEEQYKLAEQIHQLKKEDPQMRAFLIGGDFDDSKSVYLGEDLKRIFRQEKIPYSTLWGHTQGTVLSDIAYSPAQDTWYVCTQLKKGTVNSLDSLKAAFEQIDLAPGDEVVIGDQRYQPEDVRKTWEIFG